MPLLPVTLTAAQIRIEVHGQVASTTVELRFHNPNWQVPLEGELVFPLGPGQTVSGCALNLNGTLQEGVAISKERARVVFETLLRGRIDPSLVELTRGNLFRTRVYPTMGEGYRRLTFSFEQELVAGDTGDRYVLPLQWLRKLDKLDLERVKPETDGP